ncbi:alpha/beta fold hydrolase [Nocardia gamkensis]|uniref:Alpha/beta fold hydrolase n=1 Tax=Nocardia gamkensis TaxID=352869 RepID=A0A7X6L6G3_9NOCA|nr:alpha/beta fold hydrolase [Nocardia gamkensis]NKY28602.1 alpha/beta fold hydrolase [Nocardia gamkensis]NQE71243.1 hypothetical protein [Nocardia gamkensis]
MKYFVVPGESRHLDQATRAELRGDFIECGDGITHYEMAGPEGGEVVVFAGSLTTPLFYWDQLVGELHSRGFRTVTFSAYGRGYSDRVAAAYDEALFVRQIAELTQRLDLAEPFHLVGASMGALVAMAFHIVSPCGHMVPYEEPARTSLLFTAFVDTARKESSR